jgi:micrococcal nuclease
MEKEQLKGEVRKTYKKEVYFIVIVIVLVFIINYSILDKALINFLATEEFMADSKECFVSRIVDGDTIIACDESTRMLGINTPEKGEKYSDDARKFLEQTIINKTVKLVFSGDRKDLYNRTLAYVFYKDQNINQKIIENGFANFYFPTKRDSYYEQFKTAWTNCVLENKNFCKKSVDSCGDCILIKELNYKDEEIILENICSFQCNLNEWKMKDEGRKIFTFKNFILNSNEEIKIIVAKEEINQEGVLNWIRKDYVLTDSGDTIFLRDENGDLVDWKNF